MMNHRNIVSGGFTLVELLIAMAISGIVMAGVMTAFLSQHGSYLVQDNVVEMQQNIRAAMELITSEVRMAGYDPSGNASAGIVTATAGRLGFTQDLNDDGLTTGANESITYGFSTANDANGDGMADTGSASLGRNTGTATGVGGSGFQPVSENFQAVEFNYLMADGTFTSAPAAATFNDIRGVRISLLVRAAQADSKFTNTRTYTSASGATWGSPYNDQFRRWLLITTIKCRNLGL
ncbi:MAG: PilW family protein [Desulfobacterium sp.]|nr:PilW family protein [Desulfobacterium sp.]